MVTVNDALTAIIIIAIGAFALGMFFGYGIAKRPKKIQG